MSTENLTPVAEEVAEDALCQLPPAYWERGIYEVFQVGEPFDHSDRGIPRHDTYMRMTEDCPHELRDARMEVNQWYYAGLKELIRR